MKIFTQYTSLTLSKYKKIFTIETVGTAKNILDFLLPQPILKFIDLHQDFILPGVCIS